MPSVRGFFRTLLRNVESGVKSGVILGVPRGMLCGTALLFSACGGLFFYPSKQLFHLPSELGVEYREVSFSSLDGTKLVGWWLPAVGVERGTVLFLHGNAENISTHISAVYWLPKRGYSVFLFDYRGYGASEGTPTIAKALEDSEAAIRLVASEKKAGFHLFGQSLGGSFAILAAAKSPERELLQSITVEGAFASFRGIMADKVGEFWLLWPFQWLPGLFVPDEPPIDELRNLPEAPLLVIQGDADPIVSYSNAAKIFEKAKEPKTLWTIAGGKHVDAFSREEYQNRFVTFLEAAGKRQ